MSDTSRFMPQPDTEEAIRFLQQFEPSGPWVLTAAPPYLTQHHDLTGIPSYLNEHLTRTFHAHGVIQLREWLDRWGGRVNLHFKVNHVLSNSSGKAGHGEINEVRWLYVNTLLRAGEPIEGEKQRILVLLTERRPGEIPAPTAILCSGYGFQALWRLNEPIVVDGTIAADRAALYNLALELAFEGNGCYNFNTSMPLPGMVNIPDDRNRRTRRRAELTHLVLLDVSRSYELSAFTPAKPLRYAYPSAPWSHVSRTTSLSQGGRNV
jgi:hypothetical protein